MSAACSSCALDLVGDERFCPRCGAPQPATEPRDTGPSIGDVGINRGTIHVEQGLRAHEMVELLRAARANRIGYASPGEALERGEALLERGALEAALEIAEDVSAKQPDNERAHVLAARACQRMGRWRDCALSWSKARDAGSSLPDEAELRSLLVGLPDDVDVLVEIAEALPIAALLQRAVEQALEQKRQIGVAGKMIVRLMTAHPDTREFGAMWERWQRLMSGDDREAYKNAAQRLERARLLRAQGRSEEAVAELLSRECTDCDEVGLLVCVGRELVDLDRHDDAIGVLERALEINPDHRAGLYELSQIYGRNRNFAASEAILRHLIRIPGSSDGDLGCCYHHLGMLTLYQGRGGERAKPYWRKARELLQRYLANADAPDRKYYEEMLTATLRHT